MNVVFSGWETFDTFDRFQTPGPNHHDLNYSSSAGTGEKGLVWDGAGGSFGSDASFTSAFRPSAAALDPFQTPTALKNSQNTPSTFYTPAAAIELAEAAVASNGGGTWHRTHPRRRKGRRRRRRMGSWRRWRRWRGGCRCGNPTTSTSSCETYSGCEQTRIDDIRNTK